LSFWSLLEAVAALQMTAAAVAQVATNTTLQPALRSARHTPSRLVLADLVLRGEAQTQRPLGRTQTGAAAVEQLQLVVALVTVVAQLHLNQTAALVVVVATAEASVALESPDKDMPVGMPVTPKQVAAAALGQPAQTEVLGRPLATEALAFNRRSAEVQPTTAAAAVAAVEPAAVARAAVAAAAVAAQQARPALRV
jgi:hypothetical protein